MGKFFVNDCNFTMEDNFLDELRNLTHEYPEIFTGIEVTTSENVLCSIAIFVGDEKAHVVDVRIDDNNEEEFAFVEPWFFNGGRWYEFNRAVVADSAEAAVQAVISHANTYLGYAFVNDGFTHNSCAMPGEDEGAVQEFLEFVRTQTDVVRIECTALKDPGGWPKIAEFRVESRNDDGGTEIEHWSVQKARRQDELHIVCNSYEGLWRYVLSAQTNTYTTYVVHETENTTVPWAILGVTNDGYTLRVTPLDMARIPVGVSFCIHENTPLTQGVFCYMLKLSEHVIREKLK